MKTIKQNWNQFLLVLKATALKQQISKFYLQIQRTDAIDRICVSDCHKCKSWLVASVLRISSFVLQYLRFYWVKNLLRPQSGARGGGCPGVRTPSVDLRNLM